MVEISDSAGLEINRVVQMEQHEGKGLYINFMGFGCSSPVLGLALGEPDDSHSIYESNGIQVHINTDLAERLKPLGGVVVDFIDNDADQQGFLVETKTKPQGFQCTGTCGEGCGGQPKE
jgi:Fe-S cluster assembly iron-binding protein IscA